MGGTAIDITAANTGNITGGISLSSGNNLCTYGVLNASSVTLAIGGATGAGVLSTPSGGGNLYLTTGNGSMIINAPITDASGGGAVTVVRNGAVDNGILTLSGTNTFTGGLVVNTGGSAGSTRLVGTQSFTGGVILNGGLLGDSTTPLTALALNNNAITVNGFAGLFVASGETLTSSSSITINSTGALDIGGSTITVGGAVSGSGTLLLNASNWNSGSTVYLVNTNNTFTGNVISANYNGGARPLWVNSFGDGGKVTVGYNSGNGSQTSKIFGLHSGAVAPLIFNVRQFEMIGSAASYIDHLTLANNSAQTFTINTDLLVNALGTRTLTLQGTGAGLSTFNGIIANGSLTSLALTKAETGTWALTKANTYTGATTISGGTLQIGNGSTTGSLSTNSTITITSPGTLTFNRSNAVVQGADFASAITGTGALIQAGSDNLTLSGTSNTFSGSTTVTSGALTLADNLAIQNSLLNTTGAGTVTLSGGVTSPTFGGLANSGTTRNLASVITSGYSSVTNITLNVSSGAQTYGGVIAAGATGMTLTKTGAGTQILGNNTFTGNVVVNGGTLQLAGTNAFANITVNGSTLTSGGTDVGRGTLGADGGTITFTGTSSYNPQRSNSQAVLLYNKNVNVSSGTTTFGMSSQYYKEAFSGVLLGSGTIVKNDSNATLDFSNASNIFTGAIRLDGGSGGLAVNSLADSASAITFNGNTGAFSLGAGTASSLLFNSRQIVLANANGGEIANNNGSALNTITINTSLGFSGAGTRTLELSGSNAGANTFDGIITNNGGSAVSLTKAGTGTWILSNAANTYTGATTVSAGILQVSTLADGLNNSNIGASANVAGNLILNGGTLRYTGAAVSIDRLFSLQVASSIDASGTGALNFTNAGAMGFNTGATAKTLTLTGINTNNNTIAASIGDLTLATAITKSGIGTWALSGANTNTGVTTISGGGTLILDYSTADNSKLANGAALTLNNGAGNITLRGGSHLETVGSLAITTGGGHTSITREVGSTAKIAFNAISRTQSGYVTMSLAEDGLATTTSAVFNGILTGGITVGSNWAKVSAGDIVALTAGDYTALTAAAVSTTVNYQLTGSLSRGALSLNSLRIVSTGDDQMLDMGVGNFQASMLANPLGNGAGGGIMYVGGGNNKYTITGSGTMGGQNGNQELPLIVHTGTLTVDMILATGSQGPSKAGVGTLVLTKANTYTGPTYVNQGVLRLAHASGAGSSSTIYVSNGASLELAAGIDIGARAINLTGNGVGSLGALRNVSGNNTYGGALTVGTGGTRINATAGLLTLTNTVTTSLNNNLTIGGAGNVTISNVVSGAGGLIKDGTGTLTLVNTNTYTGATVINQGTLVGVVGGYCSNSAVTVASAGTLEISVVDNTKQWTCASLELNNGSQLKFNLVAGIPTIAPLNILGNLSGTPSIEVVPKTLGTYPLLTVGGTIPGTMPTLVGGNGTLTWIDKTLWVTVKPAGTLIQFK